MVENVSAIFKGHTPSHHGTGDGTPVVLGEAVDPPLRLVHGAEDRPRAPVDPFRDVSIGPLVHLLSVFSRRDKHRLHARWGPVVVPGIIWNPVFGAG